MRVVTTGRVLSFLVATGLLATAAVAVSADAAAPAVPLRDQVVSDVQAGLLKMMYKTSDDDTQYFAGGRFRYQGTACGRCEMGPAVAAAALYRLTGQARYRNVAITAMDAAITRQHKAAGWGKLSVGDNAIDTMFYADHLGMMLWAFGPKLDEETRDRYLTVLRSSADSLIDLKAHTYAVNGNINIGYTVVYAMAWKLTGDERYHEAYEDSLRFTLAPGGEYQEYGYRETAAGSRTLGRDSAGYLVEKGSKGAGFDASYGVEQTDFTVQGYLVTGDERLLTLANELSNQLLRKVSTKDWTIDFGDGTRIHEPGRRDQFTSPVLLVSSEHGRPELADQARQQTLAAAEFFRLSGNETWHGIYQHWGTQVATLLMVVA